MRHEGDLATDPQTGALWVCLGDRGSWGVLWSMTGPRGEQSSALEYPDTEVAIGNLGLARALKAGVWSPTQVLERVREINTRLQAEYEGEGSRRVIEGLSRYALNSALTKP